MKNWQKKEGNSDRRENRYSSVIHNPYKKGRFCYASDQGRAIYTPPFAAGQKTGPALLLLSQVSYQPQKIVFTTIEGTTGFSCNPKYIALELLRRRQDLDLVWLVDDMTKEFPPGIRKVKNTLKNRAYELSTAAVWVDNSRKQLECRKRPGQFYLQTWHKGIATAVGNILFEDD